MSSSLLVIGATGRIGIGVVEEALAASQPVIAVARNAASLARLQARHAGADLQVIAHPIRTEGDAARLAGLLRRQRRPLGGVVAALNGSDGRGCLLARKAPSLRRVLDANLMPHLAAARHLLPLVSEARTGARYVLIGGPGSETPWAAYGPRSVSAAALRMLACALHDEARRLGVHVHLLTVDAPVRGEHNRAHACSRWPTPNEIGRRAIELIQQDNAGESPGAVVHFGTDVARRAAPPLPPAMQSRVVSIPHTPASAADAASDAVQESASNEARELLHRLISPKNDEAPE